MTKIFDIKEYQLFQIIVPPRKVALAIDGISTSQYILKIQEEGERSLSIDCIAKQSAPTPVFEWKLDGKNIDLNEVGVPTDIFFGFRGLIVYANPFLN